MARGLPFTDDHRVVLRMIRKQYGHLQWPQVAEIFNLVFRSVLSERARTTHMLQQKSSLGNKKEKTEWDNAYADVARRNRWQPHIVAAYRDFHANPNRAPITKQSESILKWDYKTRQASHLLMQDESLDLQQSTMIFNALFKAFIENQNAQPVSQDALSSQYSKGTKSAREQGKARTEVEGQEPPTKRKKSNPGGSTAAEDYQRILRERQTKEDRDTADELQAQIDELKMSLFDEEEDDEEEEDEEEEEEVWEEWLPEHEERPDYDPDEYVGPWMFRTDEDEYQASVQLGGQFHGMPAHPTAADIQRFRLQQARIPRSDPWTEGINLVSVARPTTQSTAQSAPQPPERRRGHWRFRTDADETRAVANFGTGTTAWVVRQQHIKDRAAGVFDGLAEGINVHYVSNTDATQPSDPYLDNSAEGLLALYDAIARSKTAPYSKK